MSRFRHSLRLSLFFYVSLCLCGSLPSGPRSAAAGDWPHWRGPQRNDVVDEPSGWNGESWVGKPAWKTNVGEGSTSPLVVDGRLYTMGWAQNRDTLVCLDAKSGRELWSQSYESPRHGRKSLGDKGLYSGVTSTPEYDTQTGLLYSLSTDGDLRCWDTRDEGRLVWATNLYDSYDVPQRPRVGRSGHRDYGYTSSPLVQGDSLIVEVGAKSGNLIAFDKRDGTERWRSQNHDPPGHTGGPVPIEVEGVPCVVVHTFEGVLVARIDGQNAGRTVAFVPWKTTFANSIASPAVRGNSVVVTSAYSQSRMARFDVTLDGARKVWEQPYSSKVCSPVIHEGHVYVAFGRLRCLDFDTGEQVWEGGKYGAPASIVVTSDDRLITWSNRGDLRLVEGAGRSPNGFTELAAVRNVFRKDVWPHVVVAAGRAFVKDREGNLACFVLSGGN